MPWPRRLPLVVATCLLAQSVFAQTNPFSTEALNPRGGFFMGDHVFERFIFPLIRGIKSLAPSGAWAGLAGMPGHVFLSESTGGFSSSKASELMDSLEMEMDFLYDQIISGHKINLERAYRYLFFLDESVARPFANLSLKSVDDRLWQPFSGACLRAMIHHGRVTTFYASKRMRKQQRGLIDPLSWKTVPYLGQVIYTAEVEWIEFEGQICISIDEYALIDVKRAYEDAAQVYGLYGIPFVQRHPFTEAARQAFLKAGRVREQEYATLCGVTRLREYAIQHSKDHLFAHRRLGSPPFRAAVEDEVYALLKDNSSLRRVAGGSDLGSGPLALSIHAAIKKYAANVGGIVSEMETLLRSKTTRDRDLAFAVFLDFLVYQHLSYDKTIETVNTPEGLLERLSVGFFFGGLVDLLHMGNPSPEDLLNVFQNGAEPPASTALTLLRTLFQSDFYTDQERVDLLGAA